MSANSNAGVATGPGAGPGGRFSRSQKSEAGGNVPLVSEKYGFIDKLSGGNKKMVLKSAVMECIKVLSTVIGVGLTFVALNATVGNLVNGLAIDYTTLWIVCLCFIPTVALYIITETIAYNTAYISSYQMSAKGRAELADSMKRLPLGYIKSRDPGDLSNTVMNDFSLLETTNSHTLPQLIGAIVVPALVFVGLLFVNWQMSLAMIAVVPVAFLIIALTIKLQDSLSRKQTKSRIVAANRLQEYLTGIKHIKSNNMSGGKFDRLEKSMEELMRDSIKMEAIVGPIIGIASFIVRSSMIVMTLVGSYMLIGGKIDLMTFIGFLLMSTSIYIPLTTAFGNFVQLRYTATAGERILDLKSVPAMPGKDDAPGGGDITFEDVTFKYKDKEVLRDVSITIPEGKVTALVGPSGSGKTTLTRLAARFWDVEQGTVRMCEVDIREVDPDRYLTRFSEVFQDTYLFEDSIAGNIGFGREGASFEEIVKAAKAAECHEFIERLPKGYDTRVGEGGTTLSGGEKQRIAIARALLKDAPIIILDEATSSLDATNEAAVQAAINRLVKNRTVIVIAHKLKTIKTADHIIVLENGAVVEQGKHDELMQNTGLYHRLFTMQQEGVGWSVI